MLTIILPGLSPHNKDWALLVKEKLNLPGEIVVHNWHHWKTGGELNTEFETEKILSLIGTQKVNVLAKSVGTSVFMSILPKINSQLEKVILCGIPVYPPNYLQDLPTIKQGNIVVFQNSGDPFVPYKLIEKYVHQLAQNIPVIEKKMDTHDYPYYEDFQKYLQ